MPIKKNIYEVDGKILGTTEIPETLEEFASYVSGTNGSIEVSNPKLLFGDDIVTTKRIPTFSANWARGLGLGEFQATGNGYWRVLDDVNAPGYADGVSEVGLNAGISSTEEVIFSTVKVNRYLNGFASFYGFTSLWNTENANGGYELLIGAINRGAESNGNFDKVKDCIMFGKVSEDGITHKFVVRVVKNFVQYPDIEFTPSFIPEELTIFEQIFGYYGIHPALIYSVTQQEGKDAKRVLEIIRKFQSDTTSVSEPNLALGVWIKNKGNTGNINMRSGSVSFGTYKEKIDERDPTARDVTGTINVASIAVDEDYTDGSGLLGAYTIPDVVQMVKEINNGVPTLANFNNTVTNRLFTIEATGVSNKSLFINIDLLPKSAVTLLAGQDFTQLNPGRNVLAYASAAQIDTIDFTQKITATLRRVIQSGIENTIDVSNDGSDLNSSFVAVISLSSSQNTTATDVSVNFITKDQF